LSACAILALALALPAWAQSDPRDRPGATLESQPEDETVTSPGQSVTGRSGGVDVRRAPGEPAETAGLADTKALRLLGKPVRLAGGPGVGTVADVVLDRRDATARQLVIRIDRGDSPARTVAVPAERARLGGDHASVLVDMSADGFRQLPPFDPDSADGPLASRADDTATAPDNAPR